MTGAAASATTHVWNPWQDLPWWQRGNYPVVPPPPGVTANLIDPVSQVKWDILTQSVCIPIATVLIILRLYSKIWIIRCPSWEDWTALAGYFGFLALCGLIIAMDYHGGGRHERDILGNDFTLYLKLMLADEVLYGPVICLIKLSILLLYLRIFKPYRGIGIACHIVLWFNLVFYMPSIITEVFQCTPVKKFWYPLWPGSCVNQKAVQFASAGFNLASDIAVLILPILAVRNLQMKRKKKIGLYIVFAFGGL